MSDISPTEAAAALDEAQAARNATYAATTPLKPLRLAGIFIAEVVLLTLIWWSFSLKSVAGWLGAFAIVSAGVGIGSLLDRHNPKARPHTRRDSISLTDDREFIAMITINVVPGVLIIDMQLPIWKIALVVTATVVLSMPLLARMRRKTMSQPL